MLITHHRISLSAFILLAHGYADTEVMNLLRAARLSKQVLLVRAVVDAAQAQRRAFATAGVADALELLDRAHHHAPAAVTGVLGYPLVGAWAAHCLRRLRHPVETEIPLWVDLSHLSAIATVAAIRAGIEVAMPVPVRDGLVLLPSLGCAQVGSEARFGVATVRGSSGAYRVEGTRRRVTASASSDQDTPGWHSVERFTVTDQGRTLTAYLDDLDPYRGQGMAAVGRLDPCQRATWRAQLAQAWAILVRDHPDRAVEVASAPVVVVPLALTAVAPHVSGTNRNSVGAMAMSPSRDPFVLAMAMVHEFQHSKLGAVLDLVPLYDTGERHRWYSPWRVDPRPVGGLLQGAYAFLAVGRFWGRYTTSDTHLVSPRLAEFEFARTSAQVQEAVRDLAGSGALTPPGTRFVAGLAEAAEALTSRRMPDQAARLARLVRDDHRLTWRLHHIPVERSTLDRLAEAWRRGATRPAGCPAPERPVRPAATTYPMQPRYEAARRAILDPSQPAGGGPDASLLAGDYPAAASGYLTGIRAEPTRLDLWAGLALARRRTGPPALARVYTAEPEVLVALHHHLTATGSAVEPDVLAGWLAGSA